MLHITLIALPNTMTSSLSLPVEMLNAVDEQLLLKQREHAVSSSLVALQPGDIKTAGGFPLYSGQHFEEIERTDLVILPTRWRHPLRPVPQQDALLQWLRQMYQLGATLCAVGSGSFLLAETGLLDNRPATTHWQFLEEFEQRYPGVDLKKNYLLTEADRLYCAGSINSIADLMVHLIEQFWSADIAHRVERQFSPEIRRPFHSHAFRLGKTDLHQDESIAFVQSWLAKHYADDISNRQLAELSGLSVRSFQRRFKQATGKTPVEYLQALRMDNALELLRGSNLSVGDIAIQLGYNDSSYFCRLFRRQWGQSPDQYRRAVRGKLFSGSV